MLVTPLMPLVQAPAGACFQTQRLTTTVVDLHAPGPLSAPGLEVLEELEPDFSMAQDFFLHWTRTPMSFASRCSMTQGRTRRSHARCMDHSTRRDRGWRS